MRQAQGKSICASLKQIIRWCGSCSETFQHFQIYGVFELLIRTLKIVWPESSIKELPSIKRLIICLIDNIDPEIDLRKFHQISKKKRNFTWNGGLSSCEGSLAWSLEIDEVAKVVSFNDNNQVNGTYICANFGLNAHTLCENFGSKGGYRKDLRSCFIRNKFEI